MPEPYNSLVIGWLEIALALAVFHRALPVMAHMGRLAAVKFWMFGFMLGAFGIGRAFGPPYLASDAWIFTAGHYCLIGYTVLRLHQIARSSNRKWWTQP